MTISRITRFDAELITDTYSQRIIEAFGKDVVKYNDDFVSTPVTGDNITGWTTTLVEAGAGESTLTKDDASGGVLLFTTDAAENDGLNAQLNGECFRVDNNSFYFGVRFKISDATQSDFFVGLSVTDTAILTNLGKRIGFRKIDGETGVTFEMKKTNTTSVSNICTMVADTYVILEFLYDKTAGKLFYYVNGTEYGTIDVSNIPDTEIKPSINFLTGEAAVKTMSVDWMRAFQFGRS